MRHVNRGLLSLLVVSVVLAPCTWANGPEENEKREPAAASSPSSLYAFNCRTVNVVNQDGLLDVTDGHFGHLAWVPCGDCPGLVPKVFKSAEAAAGVRQFEAIDADGRLVTTAVCGGIGITVSLSAWLCNPDGNTQASGCSGGARCTDHKGCSSGGDCTQGSDCSSGAVCTSGSSCSTGWDCTYASSGCSEGPQCTSANNCSSGRDCTLGTECSSGAACTSAGECSTGSDCTYGEECSSGNTCTGGPDCSEVEDCTEGTQCSTGDQCTAGGQCSDHNDCTSEGSCTAGPNCSSGDECTSNSGCSSRSAQCSSAPNCTSNYGCSAGATQCGPNIANPGALPGMRMANVGRALDGFGRENGVEDLSALLGLSVLGFGFAGAFVGRARG